MTFDSSQAANRSSARLRARLMSRLLPELSEASAETLDIIRDVNQISDLLCSLEEARTGKLVSLEAAFGDL